MTVEYAPAYDEAGDLADDARSEVVGPHTEPAEPQRVLAQYHVECHKQLLAERNERNEWPPE